MDRSLDARQSPGVGTGTRGAWVAAVRASRVAVLLVLVSLGMG